LKIALLSLLTVCCLMLAVAPAMADTLYSNGAYNGTNDAWTINFGFAVSDSFSLSGCAAQGCSVESLHIVYWDASSTDLLTTVDMQLGATSFSGTVNTLRGATNQFISTNQYGYFLYSAWFTFANLGAPNGTSYVTLSNACSTSGCSVSNPIYWDENSGGSTAYENTIGSIPSEAFTLDGNHGSTTTTTSGTTPEPSSIMLFGSGILGLAGVLRRKLSR
jgi:PEP-CTERM motif